MNIFSFFPNGCTFLFAFLQSLLEKKSSSLVELEPSVADVAEDVIAMVVEEFKTENLISQGGNSMRQKRRRLKGYGAGRWSRMMKRKGLLPSSSWNSYTGGIDEDSITEQSFIVTDAVYDVLEDMDDMFESRKRFKFSS